MSLFIILFFIILLILINAVYVSGEFSTISSRRPRLSQLASEGNSVARGLLKIVEDTQKLDEYIASCQVGITISSLALGYYGQGQVADLLTPWFSRFGNMGEAAANSISATIILIILTMLQALLGELVPKNIGLQYPEELSLLTYTPMRWSSWIFKPIIWLFNGSGNLILRIFNIEPSVEHAHIHAPEEILMLVEESGKGGVLDKEERRLLKNTLAMREALVRQVMIPRTKMLAAPDNLKCNELLALVANSEYSRIPLYRGSIDNIVGMVHLKDLLCLGLQGKTQSVQEIMHPMPFVPETTSVRVVFSLLQRKHFQVAIVLDEYGGTAGMITIEDLLEEIFGELQDEFDIYIPPLRITANDRLMIRGDYLVENLNEFLLLELPENEIDTIGGLVLNAIGSVPKEGDEVFVNGCSFRVEKMQGRGISLVSMSISPEQIKNIQERE